MQLVVWQRPVDLAVASLDEAAERALVSRKTATLRGTIKALGPGSSPQRAALREVEERLRREG
jgi:hypothetical protein